MKLSDDAAETALVAALLLGHSVPDELDASAFFSPRNRLIVAACLELRGRGVAVDANAVGDWLAANGKGDALRPSEILDGLGAFKVWHKPAELWASVADYHATRRVVDALADISRAAGSVGAEELVGLAYESLSRINTGRADDATPIADVVAGTFRDMQARYEAAENGDVSAYGIPTGLRDLDELIGGITEGVVTIVAGRPSHGKSSLTRTIADNANLAGCGVHVFSPEDRKSTYGMRLLADRARVDLGRLRTMKGVTKGELSSVMTAANEVYQRRNWLVDDSAGLTSAQIAMRIRRRHRGNSTRLVVVDYVQLVREKARDMKDSVGISINTLAQVARDEGVAMVVLSQLSRDVERRPEKRPQLSDLRETGELEQVAESVVFVMQPAKYLNPDNPHDDEEMRKWTGKGMAIVAKHKNSATGQAVLAWDGPTATYRDLAKRDGSDWREGY